MTGNAIRDDGAKALSKMLRVNTTLTSLNLRGEKEGKGKEQEWEKENE